MSRAYAVSDNGSTKSSIGLVALLILSSLGSIQLAPTASASVSGDYEITASISPLPGDYISAWDPVYFEVEVTNSGFFFNSQTRSIEWFVCEGDLDESSCYNDREDYGIGNIEPVVIGENISYLFSQYFSPNGDEGLYTIVYRFFIYNFFSVFF